MRTVAVAFILINIALSNAVFLKKTSAAQFNIINQLKSYEENAFGRQILDTVALQMKNKAPLEDIARLLKEIHSQMQLDQRREDNDHNTKEAECKQVIDDFTAQIEDATKRKEDAEGELTILTGKKAQLEGNIRNYEVQLTILTNREEELKQARIQDRADFERRQQEGPRVAEAIDLIITKLKTITPETPAEEAMIELAKIGANNPILSLAQVASTFSKDRLDSVIAKMEQLRQSLEASLDDDKTNEQEEEGKYNALLGEIDSTRINIQAQLNDARDELSQTNRNIEFQEGRRDKAIKDLTTAQDGKAAKEAECSEARALYEKRRKGRTAEIAIVEEVQKIIATKIETMQDYLKERVDK